MGKKQKEYNVTLTEKQGILLKHFLSKDVKEILYGGGARGGKTRGVAELIIASCLQYPGIAWLVGRKEWDKLRSTTLRTIMKVMGDHGWEQGKHYSMNMQTKEMKFFNGSVIFFKSLRQLPSDPIYQWLGSLEITHAFVDEAQEVSRIALDTIMTRMTEKVTEYGIKSKLIMGCNPGKGHLYGDFIKPYMDGKEKKGRVFIPALYTDNPFVDRKQYEEQYMNSPKPVRERLLKGNWEYDDSPGRLYDYDDILDMFNKNKGMSGDFYITCDVARHGRDNAVILVWKGWKIIDIKILGKCGIDELKDEIDALMNRYDVDVDNVIADEDGVGGGLIDILGCKGFINNSSPIHPFAAKITEYKKKNFQNLKTQCYFELAKPIKEKAISIRTNNTDFIDALSEELDIIVEVDIDKDGRKKIISKQDIKNKLGRSPDFSDAMMMRMWFELKNTKPSYVEEIELNDAKEDNPYIDRLIEMAETDIARELEEAFNEKMEHITEVY